MSVHNLLSRTHLCSFLLMWSHEFAGGVRGREVTGELSVVASWNLRVPNEITCSPFQVCMFTSFSHGLKEFAGGDHRSTMPWAARKPSSVCSFALIWGLAIGPLPSEGLLRYRSKQLLALIFVMLTFQANCQSEGLQSALLSTVLLLVCRARRPADFLHSGDLSALGMRYLPWIVGSWSLLRCRSSSRVCRGAASRGCLECSTSPLQMWFSVLNLGAPTWQPHVCREEARQGHRHRRARLPAERAGKLLWRSLRGSV